MLHLDARGKRNSYAGKVKRSRSGDFGHACSEDPGAGIDAWIRYICPHRADEQGRFPAQCRLVISRDSAITEEWPDRWRMEAIGKQQASEVLRADSEGAKETQSRNARMESS